MRLLAAAACVLGYLAMPLAAGAADLEPVWHKPGRLPAADRAILNAARADLVGETDTKGEERARWRQMEAATVPTPGGASLLLARLPSRGNCGEWLLTIFGPADASGQREVMENGLCLTNLALRAAPGRPLPDLIIPIGDLADQRWTWDGKSWADGGMVEAAALSSPQKGDGGDPRRLDGSYDLLPVLRAPAVRQRLQTALGPDYVAFLRNLSVRPPNGLEGDCLTVRGLAPHEGTMEEAALALCPKGVIHAALWTQGRLIVASPASGVGGLPETVRGLVQDDFAKGVKPQWRPLP